MGKEGDAVLEKGGRMNFCWVVVFPVKQLVEHLQALQREQRGGGSVGAGRGKTGVCRICLLFTFPPTQG